MSRCFLPRWAAPAWLGRKVGAGGSGTSVLPSTTVLGASASLSPGLGEREPRLDVVGGIMAQHGHCGVTLPATFTPAPCPSQDHPGAAGCSAGATSPEKQAPTCFTRAFRDPHAPARPGQSTLQLTWQESCPNPAFPSTRLPKKAFLSAPEAVFLLPSSLCRAGFARERTGLPSPTVSASWPGNWERVFFINNKLGVIAVSTAATPRPGEAPGRTGARRSSPTAREPRHPQPHSRPRARQQQ